MGNALHTPGPPGTPGPVDAAQARLDDAGLIAAHGPSLLDVRTGVMWGPGSTTLITGTSDTAPMKVLIAPHHWVTSRQANDGVYRGAAEAGKLVDIGAAPASGTRTDTVWVKQNDAQSTISPDGTTAPVYGVTPGAPGKQPIPVGAEELGTVAVSAGATATNGAGIVITQTARQTVARGADTPVRSQAERDALTTWPLRAVRRLDTGAIEMRNAANTAWVTVYDPAPPKAPLLPGIELLRTTASGGFVPLATGVVGPVAFAAGQVQRNVGGYYTGGGAAVATIPAGHAGLHLLSINAQLDASITGRFLVDIKINGAFAVRANGAGEGVMSTARAVRLAVGDQLAVEAFQNSGATRNLVQCGITAHLIST